MRIRINIQNTNIQIHLGRGLELRQLHHVDFRALERVPGGRDARFEIELEFVELITRVAGDEKGEFLAEAQFLSNYIRAMVNFCLKSD